jgi:hypothetical protein
MKLKNRTALDLVTRGLFVDPEPAGDPPAGGGATPPNPPTGGDGTPTQQDIANLQEALRKERALREARDKEIQRIATENPALVEQARREAEAERQRAESVQREAQVQIQAMQQRLEADTAKIRGEAQAAAEAARRETLRVKTEREFNAAEGLTDASEIDGSVPFDLAWKHFGDRFEEDSVGIYLKRPDGTPETDPETNKRITPRQFFEKLRDDRVHGTLFKPRYGSGGGSRAGVPGRVQHGQSLVGMSSRDLLRLGLEDKPTA